MPGSIIGLLWSDLSENLLVVSQERNNQSKTCGINARIKGGTDELRNHSAPSRNERKQTKQQLCQINSQILGGGSPKKEK